MNTSNAIARVIDDVESQLSRFYKFTPSVRAADHLVDGECLESLIGLQALKRDDSQYRAAVYLLSESAADELHLGIHISDSICKIISEDDPLARLSNSNLDALCAVVEEVSHFHLIINRALAKRTVSRLELEFQAEIDKLVVASTILRNQVGDGHLRALAKRLYDEAVIVARDFELYWRATKCAAQFWQRQIQSSSELSEGVRRTLCGLYDAPLELKLAAVAA